MRRWAASGGLEAGRGGSRAAIGRAKEDGADRADGGKSMTGLEMELDGEEARWKVEHGAVGNDQRAGDEVDGERQEVRESGVPARWSRLRETQPIASFLGSLANQPLGACSAYQTCLSWLQQA
jgi:hypothetical protein